MMTSMKSSTVASIRELGARKIQGRQCCYKLHTVLVPYKDLTVQHLVVTEDIIDHLFVEAGWRVLKGDFHAAGLFRLEVDVSGGK